MSRIQSPRRFFPLGTRNVRPGCALLLGGAWTMLVLLAPSTPASGQGFHFGISRGGITFSHGFGRGITFAHPAGGRSATLSQIGSRGGFDSRRHTTFHSGGHRVDVGQLDRYADQLAEVAGHLHEDSHRLSPACPCSSEVEALVTELEALTRHMHDLLHDQVRSSGRLNSVVERHLSHDVREARRLVGRLDRALRHRSLDAVTGRDVWLIRHMRQILDAEAYPLLYRLDIGLWGRCAYTTGGVICRPHGGRLHH